MKGKECFFCEESIKTIGIWIKATIRHWHGEILSRGYEKDFHIGCFDEFEQSQRRPNRATRYVIVYSQQEVTLKGVEVA